MQWNLFSLVRLRWMNNRNFLFLEYLAPINFDVSRVYLVKQLTLLICLSRHWKEMILHDFSKRIISLISSGKLPLIWEGTSQSPFQDYDFCWYCDVKIIFESSFLIFTIYCIVASFIWQYLLSWCNSGDLYSWETILEPMWDGFSFYKLASIMSDVLLWESNSFFLTKLYMGKSWFEDYEATLGTKYGV